MYLVSTFFLPPSGFSPAREMQSEGQAFSHSPQTTHLLLPSSSGTKFDMAAVSGTHCQCLVGIGNGHRRFEELFEGDAHADEKAPGRGKFR
jgi:hypothetical protein